MYSVHVAAGKHIKVSVPQNWQFCQILVIDIPKYISLSSFNCKKFCKKIFFLDRVIKKNDYMNKIK